MRKELLFAALLSLSMAGGPLSFLSLPAAAATTQQTIKVSGVVVDQEGEPLIGATVKVKGISSGTVTDFDGNFSIDVPSNATLVLSYIGFKDLEVPVQGQSSLGTLKMVSDSQVLEQVVVVGY